MRRDWREVVILTVLPALLVVAIVSGVAAGVAVNTASKTAKLARENAQASVALCVLRTDLQRRADAGTKFLAEHPAGIPGIPARTLRDSIANQQRTISALRRLDCKQ